MPVWLDNLITCVLGIWIGGAVVCFVAFITSHENGCIARSVLKDLLSGPTFWTRSMWYKLLLMFVGAMLWPFFLGYIKIHERR